MLGTAPVPLDPGGLSRGVQARIVSDLFYGAVGVRGDVIVTQSTNAPLLRASCPPASLSLSLSLSPSRCPSRSLSRSLSFSHSFALSISFALFLTLDLSRFRFLSLFLSFSLARSICLHLFLSPRRPSASASPCGGISSCFLNHVERSQIV